MSKHERNVKAQERDLQFNEPEFFPMNTSGSLAGKTKLMLSLPEWHKIKGNYSLDTYSLSRRKCIIPQSLTQLSIHGKFLRKFLIYAKTKSVCLKDFIKEGR